MTFVFTQNGVQVDNKLKLLFYAVTKMTFRTKEKVFYLFHRQHGSTKCKRKPTTTYCWLHFHFVYKMNNFPLYFYESTTKNYYHNVSENKNTLYTSLFYSYTYEHIVLHALGHYYYYNVEYSIIFHTLIYHRTTSI